ncbi:MAG: nucleotidyltransferase domain-containing protein [Nitrospirota bacterium]|nr:nucleotidyltransferase domain-containing protein [Nitrospirota bacterium]MDH5769437.1 nucleotidyltransferase domain-containing protein [Nitrospirota bacterium]
MIKFERLPANILSRIPEVKRVLAQDDNVIFAYIFGGLAEGKDKPLSDIDISVYLRDTDNLAEYKLQLFNMLADVLGTSELDLIILNTAPISITGRILQNKQILVDKEPSVRHAYESLTLRKFFDFRIKEDALFSMRYGIGR